MNPPEKWISLPEPKKVVKMTGNIAPTLKNEKK